MTKEGYKLAQNFCARNKACGLSYFCCISETSGSDFNILNNILTQINSDKKAKEWAKMLVSCDDNDLIALLQIPSKLSSIDNLDINEWTKNIQNNFNNVTLIYIDNEISKIKIHVKTGEEIFTFKLQDEIIQKSINLLKERKLFNNTQKDEESDEEDYATKIGIEW
jgi:hypothetical protein